MERIKQNSVIFQGLFLIAFALYAKERNASHPLIIQNKTIVAAPEAIEEEHQSPSLNGLYSKLKSLSIFLVPVDGVKLLRTDTAVVISLQSDELYRDGEVAIEETWFPMIEQIGNAVFPVLDPGLKLSFVGFANSLNEAESKSAAFQQSPYLFSTSRAEWLFRYYDSKFRIKTDKRIPIMSGAGAIPNGKRVELRIEEN